MEPERGLSMWTLMRYLKPYWRSAVLAPLCMMLEVYMDLLQPKYMANIVDNGVLQRNIHSIETTGLFMIGIAVIGLISGVGCNLFASRASLNFGADVRAALFAKTQSFSFRNLDHFKSGSLITRMTNDVVLVQNLVQMFLQMLVRAPGLAFGSVIMALTISLHLGLILAVSIPVLAVFLYFLIRFSYPLFSKVQAGLDAVNTVLQENLAGIRVVKAFVRSDFENKRFQKSNDMYTAISITAGRVVSLNMPVMTLMMNGSIVAVLWFGGHQVWGGTLRVGDLIAFINYATQVLSSLMMVSMILVNVSQATVSARRINEVLAAEADIANPPQTVSSPIRSGRVVFEDVSFSYGNANAQEMVLKNLSFVAEPGQTVAIIGSTGAGKSSLVNLIPRLYDVTDGCLTIDGIDVRSLDLLDLRSRIGVVLQESILFTGSIRDNIRFGQPDASDNALEAAARAAQAHDFIMNLPEGYDTLLGQRGINLSGGQKQRIAIARALLIRPSILIMDDSTSALDLATESRLQRALTEVMATSTTFLIAQRISSVIAADKILVIEDGQKVGEGTHAELMTTCLVYQDIYHSQLGKEAMVYG